MRKVVIHRPGGYQRLELEEHPDPVPGPGQVLVEVAAAGVNFADCVVRMGLYRSARDYVGWPITPGFEVAGKVTALGGGVVGLEVSEPVLAVTRFGGYSSHLVVPREHALALPRGLSMAQAAGVPTVFLTAYYALHELVHPRPGQVLLVHSAAGGVGGALVQLGKLAGCSVVAVVGAAHKVEVAREHGADRVVDASAEPLWAAVERHAPAGFDAVFDANGAATLRASYQHLRAPGKLVVYGFHSMFARGRGRPSWARMALAWLRTPRFDPLLMTHENRSVLAFNLSYLFEEKEVLGQAMGRILGWLEEGRIRPLRVTTFPLERAADAHRALESGTTVGKLVLTTG